jgi:hypothetical protein
MQEKPDVEMQEIFDTTIKVPIPDGNAEESDSDGEPFLIEFACLSINQKFVYLTKALSESLLEEEQGKCQMDQLEQYLCERELRDLEAACGL